MGAESIISAKRLKRKRERAPRSELKDPIENLRGEERAWGRKSTREPSAWEFETRTAKVRRCKENVSPGGRGEGQDRA